MQISIFSSCRSCAIACNRQSKSASVPRASKPHRPGFKTAMRKGCWLDNSNGGPGAPAASAASTGPANGEITGGESPRAGRNGGATSSARKARSCRPRAMRGPASRLPCVRSCGGGSGAQASKASTSRSAAPLSRPLVSTPIQRFTKLRS
eukprot:6729659-Pyramimonas_sp.AAC.1